MAQEKAQEKATATATATMEEPVSSSMVDEAISSIEKLYETLTGSPPSSSDTSTPIPVERDPGEFVRERLEHLVDALGKPAATGLTTWSPPMVVWENEHETVACLDLPGVKRKEIEVLDEGGTITVTGQRAAEIDGYRSQLTERPLGPFRRQIVLPRGTQTATVGARLEDGVLELRIAKTGTAPEVHRKIEIR